MTEKTRNALRDLHEQVNVTDGASHPLDHSRVVELFRILKKAGEALDPSEVAEFLITMNWSAENAARIADVAEKVMRDHRFRNVTSGNWPPEVVAKW